MVSQSTIRPFRPFSGCYMFSHVLHEAPVKKALTVDEAKRQLRLPVEFVTDDAYFADLIDAATGFVEDYLSRSLISQKWKLTIDAFPLSSTGDDGWWDGVREGAISMLQQSAPVELPRFPVQSITSIKVTDPEEEVTTVDPTVYHLNAGSGRVTLRYNKNWPRRIRPFDGVEIIYVTGYGDEPGNVPAQIRQALRILVAYWYENREVGDAPPAVTDILEKHRTFRL